MEPEVVLCMAGLYRRFRDAGYDTPKYLLPLGDRTILGEVIAALGPPRRLLLVANQRDRAWEDALRAAAPGAGLRWIGDTSGQAETAAFGARAVLEEGWDGPIVFHNIDTVLRGRDLARIGERLARADGYVDVFPADDPAYGYVALDGDRVVRIAEKEVISPHATSGLYGFASARVYLDAFAATVQTGREFYVADVYRTMLARGQRVEADPRPSGETLVLGTPAEYEAWRARSR